MPELARTLVKARPDAIWAGGLPAARAARSATDSIPIVALASIFLEAGLVSNLGHPGGNLTGVTSFAAELEVKRLAVPHELLPWAQHVTVLRACGTNPPPGHMDEIQLAARQLGATLEVVDVEQPEGILDALRNARANGVEAVNFLNRPLFLEATPMLTKAALNASVPLMCQFDVMAEAGCAASYRPTSEELFRKTTVQIVRVLQGASVADLPVEHATRIELIVNLRTMKALNLTLPPSVLARADKVIE